MELKKHTIGKAVILLTIGTLLSKMLGFVRELVVAYKFGAGCITDAFVLTNSIPPIIFSALGSAITISFIPAYQSIKDVRSKNRFTSNLINIIIAILVLGSLLICMFPEAVLLCFGAGMPENTRQYAIVMLRIAAFSIIPVTLTHLLQALAQSNDNFWSTSVYGTITNLVVIGITLIAVESTFWLLSVGTVVSAVIGMVVVLFIAVRAGFRYYPVFDLHEEHLKGMVLLALPLMVEDVASNMTILVDRNLASFLDSGTISGLGYAGTLGNISSTVVAASIITATFPTFSRLIAEGKHSDFENKFLAYGKVILFVMCPISAAFIFFAKDIVVFVFQHGAFSSDASRIVWESLLCYAIGIVPSAMQSYFLRLYYSLKNTKTPVKIKLFSFACNIILNIASYRILGHIGIALSTSLSFIIAYCLLGHYLIKSYGYDSIRRISYKMVISMIWVSAAGALVSFLFGRLLIIESLFLRLAAELILFAAIYIVVELLIDASTVKRLLKR